MTCMVCEKHTSFGNVFDPSVLNPPKERSNVKPTTQTLAQPIAKRNGFWVSHFPILEGMPALKGHLLIESDTHLVDPTELTDLQASSLGLLIRDCTKLHKQILKAEHSYVFRINDKVEHFHVHVIPRYLGTPKEFYGYKILEWQDSPKIDLPEVDRLSKMLADVYSAMDA